MMSDNNLCDLCEVREKIIHGLEVELGEAKERLQVESPGFKLVCQECKEELYAEWLDGERLAVNQCKNGCKHVTGMEDEDWGPDFVESPGGSANYESDDPWMDNTPHGEDRQYGDGTYASEFE